MYNNYFGLDEAPFSILPDPRFLYMSERHREAFAHLLYGIRHDGGFVLLTGEVGTGKTTVCRCILEQMPDNVDLAFIVNPRLSVLELLAAVCDEFGIEYPAETISIKVMVDRINAFLLEKNSQGRRAVLVIDEAQNLDVDVLEQIRLLTNLETNTRKLLQIVMLGQPELVAKLAQPELRQLSQRITARYHLSPLTRDEVAGYVSHRLAIAGITGQLFAPACIGRLYQLSGGIPRIINLICDRALLGAYSRNIGQVDLRILNQAAKEVLGDAADTMAATPSRIKKPAGVRIATAGLIGLFFLAAIGVTVFLLGDSGPADETSAVATRNPAPQASQANQALERSSAELIASLPIARESSVPAAVAGFDWPKGENPAVSKASAYAAIFQRWQAQYPPGASNPCRHAESIGLRCLFKQGSIDDLYRTNRPAVLEFTEPGGGVSYAPLLAMTRDRALLVLGGSEREVAVTDMGLRWSGGYTVLWRPPAGYVDSVFPGDSSPVVGWVAERLRVVLPDTAGRAAPYGRDLERVVKKFQYERGLVPDGVIGVQTLIQLAAAFGEDPLLHPDKEGQ